MALLALSAGVMAADERDPRSALRQVVHPLVGTWIVDTNVADEQDPPALLTIGGDGTIRLTDCCNAPAAGAWAPSSTRTADATLLLPWFDEDGFMGFNVVRADVVVSADGATLTGTYTMDIPSRDGSTSGQLGPVSASGRRVAVEPMGTPVAPLPIQSPEMDPSASPEPSPAP
jgi:hypothetical protein